MVIAASPAAAGRLTPALEAGRDIVVAGQLAEPAGAVVHIGRIHPDVIILDLAGEDCQRTVQQIMGQAPTPILVLVSQELGPDCDLARSAKAAGAVETFPKPAAWTPTEEAQLRRSVRLVRGVQVVRHGRGLIGASPRAGGPVRSSGGPVGPSGGPVRPSGGASPRWPSGGASPPRLVAIAASTGGPAALATVLAGLDGIEVPVLVIQHIHRDFVAGLIAWMDRVSAVPVRLAVGGERLQAATVYFGPGGVHLKVAPGLRIALDREPASRHRPSADELFFSVAEYAGAEGIGVILTGMGNDGTEGLLAIRRRGGLTIAQDEATSAVFGMPRAALMAGAASQVLPVDEIATAIVAASQRTRP